jgi:hypothetical protein
MAAAVGIMMALAAAGWWYHRFANPSSICSPDSVYSSLTHTYTIASGHTYSAQPQGSANQRSTAAAATAGPTPSPAWAPTIVSSWV